MKFSPRLILITIGSLVALSAMVVGLVFNSSFQRWMVLRAAGSQPDLKIEVRELSAGLRSLSVRGVQLQKSGVVVKIDRLEADFSLWFIIVHRRLHIERLVASGVLLDASRAARGTAEAGTAAGSVAAPGVLAHAQLPVEIVLGDCDIQGRALLPGAPGKAPVQADFTISGGKIAPGQEGVLLLDARLTDPSPAARVNSLNVRLSLRVVQTLDRRFSEVGVNALVDADGPQMSGESQLKLAAQVERSNARESYKITVDTLAQGIPARLVDITAELAPGAKNYLGQWTLKANAAQVRPFFLGGALPDFDVAGAGRFSFQQADSAATFQGLLDVTAGELGAIRPSLRALGDVKIRAEFDVAREGAVVRLNALDLALAGAQPVLAVHATRAVEVNLVERRLVVGGVASGEILRLKLMGLPLAWVRPFVSAFDLSGGNIVGEIALVGDGTRLNAQTIAPLRMEGLTIVQEGKILLSKADVSLRAKAELAPTELKGRLLDFSLRTPTGDSISALGEIHLPSGKSPAVTVSGRYSADLPTLATAFIPLGPVRVAGESDFTFQDGKFTVRRWTSDLTSGKGEKIFSATSLREFSFDPIAAVVTAGAGAAEFARVSVGKFDLGPLLPVRSGVKVAVNLAPGDFVFSSDGEKITLRATTPLKLTDLSVVRNGRLLATRLSIEANPTLVVGGGSGLRVQSGDVVWRAADGSTLLTAKSDASTSATDGVKVSASFQLELPALASQPMFAEATAVVQGRASGELRAVLNGPAAQIEARVTLNNLVAREGNRPLPIANLSLRAIAKADGKISVQMPLLVDRVGQRSDLNLSAELEPAGNAMRVAATLTGEKVELDDALGLIAVFFAPLTADRSTPTPSAAAGVPVDLQPAWAMITGTMLLDVKSVTKGKDWSMTALTGRVNIDPAQLKLEKLEASFGEKGRLRAKAALLFNGGARPYQLTGDFALTEFDVGNLFKAFDPGRAATIEGVFAVAGKFQGAGATLPDLGQRTQGKFELTSRQGVFRGLKRAADKVSNTTKAVELGASVLGSLFGQEKIAKAADKLAGQAYFIDQLAASLGELPYDQFSVQLTRDESLNVVLDNVSLISPDIRLLGRGRVTHVEGKPLMDLPLVAELSLSGRGKIEQNLAKIGVLDGTRDELGYAKLKMPVTVGGTLGRPDPSPFFVRLARGKLTDFLAPDS